ISAADISACLPGSVGRGSLVTEHPREVSPLSRRGGCHPWADSPSIRSTTDRPSLPPSSLLRCLISVLRSPPSLTGRQRGYFVHLLNHFGVRSCLSAGGAPSATGDYVAPIPDHVPFWFQPDSILGWFLVTTFISTSLGLTDPELLAPDRRD